MAGNNNSSRRASCGLDFPTVQDLHISLEQSSTNGFEFICIPISHPRLRRDFFGNESIIGDAPPYRSDQLLSSEDWNHSVVLKCSAHLDCDSEDWVVRRQSEQLLIQELQFASHVGVPVTVITLNNSRCLNLARIINSHITKSHHSNACSIWVSVPMISPSTQAKQYCNNYKKENPDTWEWWNTLRTLCNQDKRVGLLLEVTADLPSEEEISRWLGESVRCLLISTDVFLTNNTGFPVLSKAHQRLVKSFAARKVQVVITGALRHECVTHYLKYIDYLWKTMYSGDNLTMFAQGFEDYLQIPLQPLMDNLDSNTYEVFEKDPVKYTEYQHAIELALIDRVPDEEKESKSQVVMVVGAGRGPLVYATLRAAQKVDRKVRVYAVEKNPNALVTLLSHKEESWHDRVTVVGCDMRKWEAPELADILVSELLGSFGDNELSPECLDGAQRFLRDDGISIPSSYTSYLVPVHSPKLYGELVSRGKDPSKPSESYNFEMPYVCHQQVRFPLSEVQPLFTYHHPNKDEIIDNTRYKSLTFDIETRSQLHGFTGYFTTVLYKDVILSIEPSTYSQGMFSWFPIFFPIRNPIMLNAGDKVVVHFWRLQNKGNVWYEWTLTSPQPTLIHNANGRAYSIGL